MLKCDWSWSLSAVLSHKYCRLSTWHSKSSRIRNCFWRELGRRVPLFLASFTCALCFFLLTWYPVLCKDCSIGGLTPAGVFIGSCSCDFCGFYCVVRRAVAPRGRRWAVLPWVIRTRRRLTPKQEDRFALNVNIIISKQKEGRREKVMMNAEGSFQGFFSSMSYSYWS